MTNTIKQIKENEMKQTYLQKAHTEMVNLELRKGDK